MITRPIFLIFLSTIISLFTYSCGTNKEKDKNTETSSTGNSLMGEWKATWKMEGDDVKDVDEKFLVVSGKMNFIDSTQVQITTNGFDGNLIMSDTTTNLLSWRLEDKILRFIDKGDVQGIPYVIEEMTDDQIKLSIMGDVELILSR